MNSWRTAAPTRRNDERRHGWATALVAALMLAGCATQAPKPKAADKPVAKTPATKPPVANATPTRPPAPKPPAAKPPVAAAPNADARVVPPAGYEQEKQRLKQALAKDPANTLPAADVGYTLDVLQGRLRQAIGSGSRMTRTGERLVVDLSGQVGFAADADQVDAAGQQVLGALGRVLVEYRTTFVSVLVRNGEVRGNADRRALSIVRVLTQAGVAPKRIAVVGQDAAEAPADAVPRVELEIEAIVRS